jgi:HK97 family phage prohead protease
MIHRNCPAQIRALTDNKVEAIISTDALVRQDGLILLPEGCEYTDYLRYGTVFAFHDTQIPVAKMLSISPSRKWLKAQIEDAPRGISAKADEINGLVHAGVLSGVSIGFDFDPADAVWIDPTNPRAGRRVKRWTLYEVSYVGVPADPSALVTARARAARASGIESSQADDYVALLFADAWKSPAHHTAAVRARDERVAVQHALAVSTTTTDAEDFRNRQAEKARLKARP